MPVQAGILNPYGTVHAVATLWLADVCATVVAFGSAQAVERQSGFSLAINLNAGLLTTSADGRLIAEVTTSHVPAS